VRVRTWMERAAGGFVHMWSKGADKDTGVTVALALCQASGGGGVHVRGWGPKRGLSYYRPCARVNSVSNQTDVVQSAATKTHETPYEPKAKWNFDPF